MSRGGTRLWIMAVAGFKPERRGVSECALCVLRSEATKRHWRDAELSCGDGTLTFTGSIANPWRKRRSQLKSPVGMACQPKVCRFSCQVSVQHVYIYKWGGA